MIPQTLEQLRHILPLGSGLNSRISLCALAASLFIKRRFTIGSRPERLFRLRYRDRDFACYLADESDLQTLCTVLGREEYAVDLQEEPRIIIDLGSNIGLSLLYFALRYPHARVYGFEPNPHAFERLQKNIRDFPNVRAFQLAVSSRDGSTEFYANKKKSISSSFRVRPGRAEKINVPTRSLPSLLEERKIDRVDILKFDVEGAEEEIFSAPKALEHIENIIGEVHLPLMSISKEEFLARFRDFNITLREKSGDRFILRGRRI